MKDDHTRATIACTLGNNELTDRQGRWRRLIESAGGELATTETGIRIRFANTPGIEAELQKLAALERACCRFADWTVRARANKVTLEVNAESEEGITAVQATFAPHKPHPSDGTSISGVTPS